MSTQGKTFFRHLDALRFLAFLAVFLSHAFHGRGGRPFEAPLGMLGVDFFFVLSSFLITWIILEEQARTGAFRLGYFYMRRILRIWPLYFLLVAVAGLIAAAAAVAGTPAPELPPAGYLLTFTLNLYVSAHGPHFLFFLVFLWSVSVEEQFYLAWGGFLRYFRRWLPAVCGGLVIVSVAFRWIRYPDSHRLYFHTLSVLSDFALGALAGYGAFRRAEVRDWFAGRGRWAGPAAWLLLALSVACYGSVFSGRLAVSVERTWFAVLFSAVVLDQCFSRSRFKAGGWPAVNYLGRISYGLYCYHGLVLTALPWLLGRFPAVGNSSFAGPAIAGLFTTFAAAVSYRFIERPFLNLKSRFTP